MRLGITSHAVYLQEHLPGTPETCCARETFRIRCGDIQADTRLKAVIGDGESLSSTISTCVVNLGADNPHPTTNVRSVQ